MEAFLQYVSVDAIVRGLALVGSVIAFLVYVRSEIIGLKKEVINIKDQQKLLLDSIQQINNILTKIAVQETRLNMIEKDIDELRHGQGFIK